MYIIAVILVVLYLHSGAETARKERYKAQDERRRREASIRARESKQQIDEALKALQAKRLADSDADIQRFYALLGKKG